MNDFDKKKKNVVDEISRVISSTTNDFNEREENCSNGMFTSAVTYLAILFAFCNNYTNIKEKGCGWCIVVSVIALSLSLLTRLADFLLVRSMYRRHSRISKKMSAHLRCARDESVLYEVESAAADLLNDEKSFTSSSVPIMLQMTALIIGVIFSVVALIIAVL